MGIDTSTGKSPRHAQVGQGHTRGPLAVDVVAQAIRVNPRDVAAGTLAERYLRSLHAANYKVIDRAVYDDILAALKRMTEFVRTVPLDVLPEAAQDECWNLDRIGRAAIARAGGQ